MELSSILAPSPPWDPAIALRAILGLEPDDPLPATLDGATVARLFDLSYDALIKQVRRGVCVVQPLRAGRSLRWATAAVLRPLG